MRQGPDKSELDTVWVWSCVVYCACPYRRDRLAEHCSQLREQLKKGILVGHDNSDSNLHGVCLPI